MSRRRNWRWPIRIAAVTLSGLIAAAGWGLWIEPSSLHVEQKTLFLENWHGPELTIALMSDLHGGSPFFDAARMDSVVASVNESRPDLILLAGDYVIQGVLGGTFVPPEQLAESLSELRAPLGVYAVLGNHDWWLDGERVKRAFEHAGIPMLDHRAERKREGAARFWLVGFGDFWEDPSDVEEVLSRVTDGAPVIAFTHNPDLFPSIPSRVDLTLAGHTHGGQVRLPLLGTPVVPSRYGSRYARGLIREDSRQLYVTSGLGSSILPIRFRVPPEFVILTVRAGRLR